MLAIHTL